MRIKTKEDRRDRIKFRIRKRMSGTAQKPRLSVFRSVAHIYVQVIDDMNGTTIASASTVDPKVKGQMPKGVGGGNVKGAEYIGTTIANLGMTDVRFPAPLFEGDTVRATTEILSVRESKSREGAGIVEFHHRAYKQDGTLVAEARRQAFMRKKPV